MSQKLIRTSLLFTAFSVLASGLNFLYYPVAAHTLSLAEFGDVQVGISFIMQAAALFTSLNTLALFFAAQGKNRDDTLAQLERIIIGTSAVLAVIVVLFAQPISTTLHLNEPSLLYLLAVIFVLNIPASTWLGSIQGEGRFVASGVIATISAGSKIAIGLIAIRLGFGAHGALIGILFGSFIILPLTYFTQKNHELSIRRTFRMPSSSDLSLFTDQPKEILLFGSLFVLAIASTVDVLASKMLLDPNDAGIFAQLSTAAKIPYFATIPLAIIAFERLMKRLNARRHIVGVFCVLVIAATTTTIIFESFVLKLFFNLQALQYESVTFTKLCIAFSSYSIVTLLTYALISRRRLIASAIIASSALASPTLLIILQGTDSTSISTAYMAGEVATLMIALALQYTGSHD